MRGFIAPVRDKEAFMGSHRREVGVQIESGRRDALLVYLISFSCEIEAKKGIKTMKQDVICPYEY